MQLSKVISSGQAGVDECALLAAQAAGLATGGTCAMTNEARDGLGVMYTIFPNGLLDTYMHQSRANVDAADGTLALWLDHGVGVQKTIAYACSGQWPSPIMVPQVERTTGERRTTYRPIFVLQNFNPTYSELFAILTFLQKNHIATLNVIGEGTRLEQCRPFLAALFESCAAIKAIIEKNKLYK